MNKTIAYYEENADAFVENTQNADMHLTQERFLKLLNNGSRILDFGCGSGRDTKYFIEKGFCVDATDGSAEICKLASEFTGTAVRHMLFQDLRAIDCYDGIWACSSILHLPKEELLPVIEKMSNALKENGVIYTSFKYGTFQGERRGRYFTDFTEDSFREFIRGVKELVIEECWITDDVRAGRGDEKWINLILRKSAAC